MSASGLAETSPVGLPEQSNSALYSADFYYNQAVTLSGLETTPRDEITGLPLPVVAKSRDYYFRRGDYHHHFHPKRSTELGYNENGQKLPIEDPNRLEGVAVRQSRGQYLPMWLHTRYHDIFYGPSLPATSKERFTAVILTCAGVVPRQAIDLYKPGEYRIADLSNRRHSFISQRIYYEGAHSLPQYDKRDNIGRYIASYAINTSLADTLTENEVFRRVEEFLSESDEEMKLEQGKYILTHAVDASVAELVDLHRKTRAEGMVPRTARRLGEIALDYFPEARFGDYLEPLKTRLQILMAG